MKLRKCMLTAVAVDALSTGLFLGWYIFRTGDYNYWLYALGLIFGFMYIPVLLTVLIFSSLRKYLDAPNRLILYLAESGVTLTIMAVIVLGVVLGTAFLAGSASHIELLNEF